MRDTPADIGAFIALGDSFTEGVGDPYPDGPGYDGSGYRGWADRFAEALAADRPGLRYANLAVRGRLVGQVAAEQVPRAVAMAPDLVSIAAGGNDLLRPRADPDALAQTFDAMVGPGGHEQFAAVFVRQAIGFITDDFTGRFSGSRHDRQRAG